MNAAEKAEAIRTLDNLTTDLEAIAGDPVMTGLRRTRDVVAKTEPVEETLWITGREREIVDRLTSKLFGEAKRYHDHSQVRHTDRGNCFDVDIRVSGELTGHVVRVTVELDRFEAVPPQ